MCQFAYIETDARPVRTSMSARVASGLVLLAMLCVGAAALAKAPETDCARPSNCAEIPIRGDAPATNPGIFRGFADPSIVHDPANAKRVWLAYSWPHVVAGKAPDGKAVQMAAVQTRLARSDDGGVSFTYVGKLWPDYKVADPEGSGEVGINSSETASLVSMKHDGGVTWYGAHLRYFLKPQTGYHPKYATSWQVRIGAASTPAGLTSAAETGLGVSTTAPVYKSVVQLDRLAGLPIQHCAMLNNPALFARHETLYLVVECLAFVRTTLDFKHSSIQVFATRPDGSPTQWTWPHVGKLAGYELAEKMDAETIQQPEIALGADGRMQALFTPAHKDARIKVGTVGDGCVALELSSMNPPTLAQDEAGNVIIRAYVHGTHVAACTYDRMSATGIVATSTGLRNGNWILRASMLRP